MNELSNYYKSAVRRSRLSDVSLLIIDSDAKLSNLLRQVLVSLGFGTTYFARTSEEGLKMIKDHQIDIIITDWDVGNMSGVQLINHLRHSDNSPNRMVPIIMLTGRAQRADVEDARDAGVTEFVVKPFTAQTICDRLTLVVEHPRNFILAPGYVGPDRRRHAVKESGKGGERRSEIKGTQKIIAKQDNVTVIQVEKSEHEIAIVDADHSIKKKIGDDISIRDILNPDNIMTAQKIIKESRDDFLTWVREDLATLEELYQSIAQTRHRSNEIDLMAETALRIKSQAGVFGFDLASMVAELLYKLIISTNYITHTRLQALRKHIDVFYVIFEKNIIGMGNKLGDDLAANLTKLAKRVADQEASLD